MSGIADEKYSPAVKALRLLRDRAAGHLRQMQESRDMAKARYDGIQEALDAAEVADEHAARATKAVT